MDLHNQLTTALTHIENFKRIKVGLKYPTADFSFYHHTREGQLKRSLSLCVQGAHEVFQWFKI